MSKIVFRFCDFDNVKFKNVVIHILDLAKNYGLINELKKNGCDIKIFYGQNNYMSLDAALKLLPNLLLYYFNEKGIPVFQGTGMYMVEYAIHKVTIAIFSIIFFLLNFGFMKEHYSEYFNLLIAGYVLTAVIATALLLFCCSKKFHGIILFLVDKLNRKGKFDAQAAMLREQCGILEDAAGMLLTKGKLIVSIVAKNLLKFAFCYGIPFVILYREYGLTLLQSWAVTSLAFMLAAVIPSPAGIGSSEFVFTALFTVLVGTGEAGSAALLYRFATFVLPFVIGGVVVLLHKRIDRRIAKRKADKAQQ